MVDAPYLEPRRPTRLEFVRDKVLPLRDLTLPTGRHPSGKSNAFDALHVVSRLAEGEGLREAIDGNRREGQETRGADRIDLDIVVQAECDGQATAERLDEDRPVNGPERTFLAPDDPRSGPVDLNARDYKGPACNT